MYPLLETIKITDGIPRNLQAHSSRISRSLRSMYETDEFFRLDEVVRVPADFGKGTVKCRLLYGRDSYRLEFQNYVQRQVKTLRVVSADVDYSLKYSDRSCLELLKKGSGGADDVLIVKKGLITDTSFSNIVFFDGHNWYTPERPLLEGTARERLLTEGRIKTAGIGVSDLGGFRGFQLINTMLEFDESVVMDMSGILGEI